MLPLSRKLTPPSGPQQPSTANWFKQREAAIAILAILGILIHLILRYAADVPVAWQNAPLLAVLALGGLPLVVTLAIRLARREFGSDLLAGISIVTSVLLGEYLAGSLVVLMLSGGESLEVFAVNRASSVLRALANRMPGTVHFQRGGRIVDEPIESADVGDILLIFPHEICPVDGEVIEGHGAMDESYLTGEPFRMSKTPGSQVLSGSINGEHALTIRAARRAVDSRYAKIMEVMRASEKDTPRLRRIGDQLGAWYTPLALAIALVAWGISSDPSRFLAVLVVATPCPLLIAIPVAVIGSISLCARQGIIVKKPIVLERVSSCRTLIFDKTGTLTYGEARLADADVSPMADRRQILQLTASLERYSKHPLARAVLRAATDQGFSLLPADTISEKPGEGLRGSVAGHRVQITSRQKLKAQSPRSFAQLPPGKAGGLECVVLVDDEFAAVLHFRDEPRAEGASFVRHLRPRHQFDLLMLVSGDRESEVQYLADRVGITKVYAGRTPEQKLEIVRHETEAAHTLYLGDGINDAPALMAATVGVVLGQNSDVTIEAAGAVIMDSSLLKVDEFMHIGRRMRRLIFQSAVGGMVLSIAGMLVATAGYLPPVAGALAQEVIDVIAVLNALRALVPPKTLSDF
ncbi:MAG: heavy metal translocating P-type ATPase [Tepidisphaeraceae bacterium]